MLFRQIFDSHLAQYAYLNAMRFLDFGYSATVMLGGFIMLTVVIAIVGFVVIRLKTRSTPTMETR